MLTPSSNTVLEPLTAAMLAGVAGVSAHFARFRVLEIALSDSALGQFDMEPMLAAADLLADAKVDVIVWNGTSAGWLGFDRDAALCEEITRRTGIAASTAVLALNEALGLLGAKTFGLVSPYTGDVQDRIIANYRTGGVDCVADRKLDISENYAFATVTEATVEAMCRDVAQARPDAIGVYCTNMRGAPVAAAVEAATGIPVLDTTATALWGALRRAGRDPSVVSGWGRLFGLSA
ncbi:aspartate/glutamate racemase family protein [Acuticoccus sp. I52.16.1]|uniref:maleate cis-trans isomerase family protein n=1 Tax=Acuticoccus sp. I52.16.1 TaxID=2928472 RepID=UPI001FD0B684|nr:aspartate/glutamate racemase family protein [Acuticoccus sp. I52.16.1]UOM36854.1 aspartate/glutamate racemase family protein [Acuticoccus sp. I52.16.1]